jgi:hypothetical protein
MLSQHKSAFNFDDETFCNIIVLACAAQAARGTGLESCTLARDETWEASSSKSIPSEPTRRPQKKQKTSETESIVGRNQHEHDRYAVPLKLQYANYLPYSLQMKATPGARDRDVSSCFYRHNLKNYLKFLEKEATVDTKPTLEIAQHVSKGNGSLFATSYLPPDLAQKPSQANTAFVLDAIFQSLVFRLTGNSDLLDLFPEWKAKTREQNFPDASALELGPITTCLPRATTTSVQEFSMFMLDITGGYDKPLGPLISKQHDGFIPDRFKQECLSAIIILDNLVHYFQPTGMVGEYVRSMGATSTRDRLEWVECLVKALSKSGNFQMEVYLKRLIHQVVLDVEGFFLDFAGPVTVDSVFPGSGGLEGLASITIDDPLPTQINVNKRSPTVVKQRLGCLLDKMLSFFKSPTRHLIRKIMGLEIDNKDVLRWVVTGREFNLCDVEHFCCKLYITGINSHASRTISETPHCCKLYSWPPSKSNVTR